MPQGALRPKLQIPFEIDEKLLQLKRILTNYLELNKIITTGATIKFLLRIAINQIQSADRPSVDSILFNIMKKYLRQDYSEEAKKAINDYVRRSNNIFWRKRNLYEPIKGFFFIKKIHTEKEWRKYIDIKNKIY